MEAARIGELRKGLESNPRYVDFELEWITEEGYKLFEERKKTAENWYTEQEVACNTALKEYIGTSLGDNVVMVDLGSGKMEAPVNRMRNLIENHPERRLLYIPVDINDTILDWPEYIKKFDVCTRVVEVKPLLMDMCDSLQYITDNILKGPYKNWEVLIILAGVSPHLTNKAFIDVIQNSCQMIKARGSGFILVNYIELSENTQQQWNRLLNSYNNSRHHESVLWGLKQLGDSDIDSTKFNYPIKYEDRFSSPGLEGFWSGCTNYAEAKEAFTVHFKHPQLQDLKLVFEKGDLLRLSSDVTNSHFYEETYLKSLAKKNDVEMAGCWCPSKVYGHCSMVLQNRMDKLEDY